MNKNKNTCIFVPLEIQFSLLCNALTQTQGIKSEKDWGMGGKNKLLRPSHDNLHIMEERMRLWWKELANLTALHERRDEKLGTVKTSLSRGEALRA